LPKEYPNHNSVYYHYRKRKRAVVLAWRGDEAVQPHRHVIVLFSRFKLAALLPPQGC